MLQDKSHEVTRRQFLHMAGLGLGGVLLGACSPRTTQETAGETVEQIPATVAPAPKERATLRYYDRTPVATAWPEAYNEQQDDVTVSLELMPPGTRYEQLVAAITAGIAPDVIGLDCVQVGRFAQIHSLVALDDLVSAEVVDSFFPSLVKTERRFGLFNDTLLGLPFWIDASAMLYNEELLSEVGGDPTVGFTNWEDYVTYCKPATKDGRFGFVMSLGSVGTSGFLYFPWIWAQGSDFISADWTASTVTEPAVENMLQFMRDLIDTHGVTNDPVGVMNDPMVELFTGDKAMSVHRAAGTIGIVRNNFPELFEVLGVCPIPGPETGQTSSFIGGNVFSISTQSKLVSESVDFIVWATSTPEGMEVTGSLGYLCGTPDGMELPPYREGRSEAIYAAFKQSLATGTPAGNDPRWDETSTVMNKAMVDAAIGSVPMAQIIEQADRDMTTVLSRAG